jgi:hypothetical protein
VIIDVEIFMDASVDLATDHQGQEASGNLSALHGNFMVDSGVLCEAATLLSQKVSIYR